jgi:hypothetical protein
MASPGKLGLAGAGLAGRKGPDQPGPPEPTLSGQTKAGTTRETNAMQALRALMAASIAIRQPAHDHRNHHRPVSMWDQPHNRFRHVDFASDISGAKTRHHGNVGICRD